MNYDPPIMAVPLCYIDTLDLWATIYEYAPNNYFAYVRETKDDPAIMKTVKFTSLYEVDKPEAIKEDFIAAYKEA